MSIVQFSQLGNFGRLGNQMFQYAFARAYAEKHNATLEIPSWIGEKLFKNVSHPGISKSVTRVPLDVVPADGQVDVDLFGYYQFKECYDLLSEAKLREWFTLQDRWQDRLVPSDEVVCHLRRGDYVKNFSGNFCIISDESYISAICGQHDAVWLSEEKPTIEEDLGVVSYKQTGNSMYGSGMYEDNGVSFLPDFFRMINAKILLRANSTFSFWAGFFNKQRVWSPQVGNLVGLNNVNFVEGNHAALFPGHCDIYFGA